MKKILLISLFCCNFSSAISIITLDKDKKEVILELNLSGFSNVRIGYIKTNILPKYIPNINTKNFVALRNSKELSDDDFATSDIKLVEKVKKPVTVEKVKKPVTDDYIRLLADLLDDNVTILERKIIEKIHNINGIKNEKIKLIELIMNQPKEFKDLLYKLISKFINDPSTISEWSIYKNFASGDKKTIIEGLINAVMK
jgi:hypothetical protein